MRSAFPPYRSAMKIRIRQILAALVMVISNAVIAQDRIDIRFHATVGDRPLACGERYSGVGASKSNIAIADFRLFLSKLELIRADGSAAPFVLEQDGVWQYQDLALLDFEDGSGSCNIGTQGTRNFVRGTAPIGNYQGLRFTLGVPPALNHSDPTTAPSPLNLTAMFWSWQAGYKFLKLDLAPVRDASATPAPTQAFSLHVGSTGCMGGARGADMPRCAQPNRVTIDLKEFDARRDVVTVDVGALLGETMLNANTPTTPAGCMSFPKDADCNAVMPRLGLAYDGHPARQQVLFSIRRAP